MSFLSELLEKKGKLKSCQTVVTSLAGGKYVEEKKKSGKLETRRLQQTCPGFVVDEKLDLQVAQILDYLYLSSQDVAQDCDLLKKHGITHVLSVGVDLPNPDDSYEVKFKRVELLDEPNSDLSKVLDSCFKFINSSRMESQDNKVLVHCNAGYSRAPTVVIAYLMTEYGYSLEESFNMVKKERIIKPNDGFMLQLKSLEKKFQVQIFT